VNKDRIFDTTTNHLYETFAFDDRVANVFDDMVSRSVPFYESVQHLVAELVLDNYDGGWIYDLGCSTGATCDCIARTANRPVRMVAMDNSKPMLELCQKRLAPHQSTHDIRFELRDLSEVDDLGLESADAVVLFLVLQFLRPLVRLDLLRRVNAALRPGGLVLVVEKTIQESQALNYQFLNKYHDFKRENGYSELEISKKREALENRLIPFTPAENMDMLKKAGFSAVSTFFCWLNFQGFIATKSRCLH
jgi:tRNA (cmo5U34)-methyltransferase